MECKCHPYSSLVIFKVIAFACSSIRVLYGLDLIYLSFSACLFEETKEKKKLLPLITIEQLL